MKPISCQRSESGAEQKAVPRGDRWRDADLSGCSRETLMLPVASGSAPASFDQTPRCRNCDQLLVTQREKTRGLCEAHITDEWE